MIIHVKQSFEIRNNSGGKYTARNGDIVVPPEWVVHNNFFKALCDSGKITVHLDSKSVELEQARGDNSSKTVEENNKKSKKQ